MFRNLQNYSWMTMPYLGEYSSGDYLLAVHATTELADGTYKADIIVDHVAPMSFVFN